MHLGSSSGSHLVQQDIKSHLTKHFFRDILAQHYHQHDLKVWNEKYPKLRNIRLNFLFTNQNFIHQYNTPSLKY